MKTLDEVIKALEYCTGFDFVRCQDCPGYCEPDCGTQNDALQYLKMYRELADDSEAFAEWKENPALTWDELRNMEGKPVWVVPEAEKGYWFVIEFFHNNPYYGGDRVCFTNDVIFNRCDLGKTWQAYRKERNENAR